MEIALFGQRLVTKVGWRRVEIALICMEIALFGAEIVGMFWNKYIYNIKLQFTLSSLVNYTIYK